MNDIKLISKYRLIIQVILNANKSGGKVKVYKKGTTPPKYLSLVRRPLKGGGEKVYF